jgi:nucleotide-binding universal stress UspA family protein
MTVVLIVIVVVLAVGLVALAYLHFGERLRPSHTGPAASTHRILFPFVSDALSARALDAALRLARAEDATLVPVFLARVSLDLPLESALPRQCGVAIPLQEAIEQRAAKFGVPVDERIERGRTYRHALRETIANERYDRIVIAASPKDSAGFGAEDVAWLLDNAPGEILVVRPGPKEQQLELPRRLGRRSRTRTARPRQSARARA